MSKSVPNSETHTMSTCLSHTIAEGEPPREDFIISCTCGFQESIGRKKPENIMWRHFRDIIRRTRVGITPPTLTIPEDPFKDI